MSLKARPKPSLDKILYHRLLFLGTYLTMLKMFSITNTLAYFAVVPMTKFRTIGFFVRMKLTLLSPIYKTRKERSGKKL